MRRASVLLLAAIVLLGTVLVGRGAFATAQENDAAEHPIIGSWVLDTDPEDPDNLPSLARFSADGGYVEFGVQAEGGNALGSWEPTGDTTATVAFATVYEDGSSLTVRANVTVAPDAQTLTADYTLEFGDPSGTTSGQIGPGAAAGVRIAVEAPGTPVTSIEEFFAQVEGTPEATPAG